MDYWCPWCNNHFDRYAKREFDRHKDICSGKLKVSKNLQILCDKLKEQLDMNVDPATFCRTYAKGSLKGSGAFLWTIKRSDDILSREMGSCYPLSHFSGKNIKIDIDASWHDIEFIPVNTKKKGDNNDGVD